MLKKAKEVLEGGDLKEIVDFAIEANREIKKIEPELDKVKIELRKRGVASAALSGEKQALLEGNLGTATVVFPKAEIRARKGVDLLAAEAGIAPEVFAALFVKVTTVAIAPDFEEKLAGLTAAQKTVINNLVETVDATPRVNLPK